MKAKQSVVLPLHRPKRLAFSGVEQARAPGNHVVSRLVGRLSHGTVGRGATKIWRICTTTLTGSLAETFRLPKSSEGDSEEVRPEAKDSAFTEEKHDEPLEEEDPDALDIVVVDIEDPVENHIDKIDTRQSDSSRHSNYGGSNSTGQRNGKNRDEDGFETSSNYQGGFLSWIRHRGWPEVVEFFEPRFPEPHEEMYQKQTWHSMKFMAFLGSLFLVLNWILYLVLNNNSTQHHLYDKIIYWGAFTAITIPVPVMVALDMPYRSPVIFQIWFCVAAWYCAFTEVIEMRECHFFIPAHKKCFGKDFLEMSYYSTGLPALMMFIVSKRIYNFVAVIASLVLQLVLILPDQTIFARNIVLFAVFWIFTLTVHHNTENAKRKMFLLALQLKQAYRAKQKARSAETKAGFLKRRFANYIFHEVRVPLNNTCLALQILQADNAFREDTVLRRKEVYALEQGLNMMTTVLNDVLDFEKMNMGHFEANDKPFPLHHSIRNLLDLIQVQTDARGLLLERQLDEQIDTEPLTAEHGVAPQPEGLWVLGSELRLQQVITNLATNAVKYTPEGQGSIRISTEYLGITTREKQPEDADDSDDEMDDAAAFERPRAAPERSRKHSSNSPSHNSTPPLSRKGSEHGTQCLTFKLIVHDSGPGIKPSDLVKDRLFQPFAQTSTGKSSGSGTGLGLAIVKQIVKVCGGRLGVISRPGEGCKFWVQLTYPLASEAEVQASRELNASPRPIHSIWKEGSFVPYAKPRIMIERPGIPSPSVSFGDPPPPLTPATSDAAAPPLPRYESNPAPVEVLPAVPVPVPSAAPVPTRTDPISVLVVDDDVTTRMLSSKLLSKLGCVVRTAEDGQECVQIVLSSPPHTFDLICLDNFMPVMTGEQAVKELRAHERDDFVVGCTGNALTEDQQTYIKAGLDQVLVKPIMLPAFKRIIQEAQDRRAARRSLATAAAAAETTAAPPTSPSPT